jgi:hypothetical protein
MDEYVSTRQQRVPSNNGKLIGQSWGAALGREPSVVSREPCNRCVFYRKWVCRQFVGRRGKVIRIGLTTCRYWSR